MEGMRNGLNGTPMKPDPVSGLRVIRPLIASCTNFRCLRREGYPRYLRPRPRSCCICQRSKTQSLLCLSWDVRTFLNDVFRFVRSPGLTTRLWSKEYFDDGTMLIALSEQTMLTSKHAQMLPGLSPSQITRHRNSLRTQTRTSLSSP